MKMKAAIILCAISLMAVTGCGEKADQSVTVVDVEKTDLGKEQEPEGEGAGSMEEVTQDKTGGVKDGEAVPENGEGSSENEKETSETGNAEKENTETLEGTVKSIGDGSIVISKAFTEEEDGVMFMYAPAEGSEDEILITVNFSENTKFILHTVKNSGINGDSDVTKTEASFSDIKEKASVSLSGYFLTPDQDYMADSVIIYKFI